MFDVAEADETLVPWSDDEEFNGSTFDPFSMLSILKLLDYSNGLARNIQLPGLRVKFRPSKSENNLQN